MCGAAVEQKEETELDGRNLAHKYVRALFYRVHRDMVTTLPCSNGKFSTGTSKASNNSRFICLQDVFASCQRTLFSTKAQSWRQICALANYRTTTTEFVIITQRSCCVKMVGWVNHICSTKCQIMMQCTKRRLLVRTQTGACQPQDFVHCIYFCQ